MGSMKDLFGDTPFILKTPQQMTRVSDPSTSHCAAKRIAGNLGELQRKVLDALRAAGDVGLTDYELEERCGSHGSTFRTRRAELVEAGMVVDSGRKRSIMGSNRIVWIIKDGG